jgi:hypothetical protein
MSQIAHDAGRGARDQIVFAIILIVVGAIGLISRWWQPTEDVGGWIVAAIGLGLLGAFFYTRNYGFLVPGGIMTGLGIGIIVSQTVAWTTPEGEGGAVVLGLGVGFALVWLIGTLVETGRPNFWALIPAGILSTIGALLILGGEQPLQDWWGIGLIAIGLLVVLRAFTTRAPTA